MKKSQFVICLVALIAAASLQAQVSPKSLRVSVLTEATALPSLNVVRIPLHPGISVGMEFWSKAGEHWDRSLSAEFSYYYHRMSEHALVLDGVYRLGYRFDFGLTPNFMAGIGYKHSILPGTVFVLENGEYSATHHGGQPQLNLKLGLGLEYRVTGAFSVTAAYSTMVATPYPLIPVSLHALFSIGTKINLHQ